MRKTTGVLLLLALAGGTAEAAQLYQWKDEAGVVHFTDNPMDVPGDHRANDRREVKPLQPVSGPAPKGAASKAASAGARLWQQYCSQCHTLAHNTQSSNAKGKMGLGQLTINPETKFPATVNELLPKLQWAVQGRLTDMSSVKISEADLKQIASFMLGEK